MRSPTCMRSRARDRGRLHPRHRRRRRDPPRSDFGREISRRRHEPRRPDARDRRAPVGARGRHRAVSRDRGPRRRRSDDRGGTRNTAVAEHPAVRARYPMLTRAIVAGASAQIRNMATVGGNLLQRTRCTYFYDTDGSRCNKRSPGEGCDAIEGFNRIHAILGGSPACVATHPSDMCVALAALDAVVHLRSTSGERTVALCELHRLPEDHPDLETVLEPGELITAVQLPALPMSPRIRPTARCATARAMLSRSSRSPPRLNLTAARSPTRALALGGVAPKPWRAWRAEEALRGRAGHGGQFPAGGRCRACRFPRTPRQRVQGRPRPPHDRRRPQRLTEEARA